MVVGPDAGLICEDDRSAFLLGSRLDFRGCFLLPFCHFLRVSSISVIKGSLGDSPSFARTFPTPIIESRTPNWRKIISWIIPRVHSADPKDSCRGSLPTISRRSCGIYPSSSLALGPRVFFVLSTSAPCLRYIFCHSNTDDLETFRTFTISSAETPFSSASHADRRSPHVALRFLNRYKKIIHQIRFLIQKPTILLDHGVREQRQAHS